MPTVQRLEAWLFEYCYMKYCLLAIFTKLSPELVGHFLLVKFHIVQMITEQRLLPFQVTTSLWFQLCMFVKLAVSLPFANHFPFVLTSWSVLHCNFVSDLCRKFLGLYAFSDGPKGVKMTLSVTRTSVYTEITWNLRLPRWSYLIRRLLKVMGMASEWRRWVHMYNPDLLQRKSPVNFEVMFCQIVFSS